MKRHYWQYLIDSAGNAVGGARIHLFLATTSNYAWIQQTEIEVTYTTTELTEILTDDDGFFHFWVSDDAESPTYGYQTTQKFRIEYSKAGLVSGEVDDVQIIWGGTDGKVKIDVNDDLEYLEEKFVAGDNITITPSAGQLIITGDYGGSNNTFTFNSVGVSGSSSITTDLDFCNRCLVYKINIEEMLGLITSYDFIIYSNDTYSDDDVLYKLEDVDATEIWIDKSPFYYLDDNLNSKLYLKIINNDISDAIFNFTISSEVFAP